MRTLPTTRIQIFLGLRQGYGEEVYSLDEVSEFLKDYCSKNPLCVTLTSTEYIYKDGCEPGCIVGLINYPRFPKDRSQLIEEALSLAEILRQTFSQYRLSVVTDDTTYLLED